MVDRHIKEISELRSRCDLSVLIILVTFQFCQICQQFCIHKSNFSKQGVFYPTNGHYVSSTFFCLIGAFFADSWSSFWFSLREEKWWQISHLLENDTDLNISHLLKAGRNGDHISHLFVKIFNNSTSCQSTLGMGKLTEGHSSQWLHLEISFSWSWPRQFYIAIFRRSDTQSTEQYSHLQDKKGQMNHQELRSAGEHVLDK